MSNLEVMQLKAKTRLVAHEGEILDVEGIANWAVHFPKLKEFWVIIPNFLDESHDAIRDFVVTKLAQSVKFVYFVRDEDTRLGGRLERVRKDFSRALREHGRDEKNAYECIEQVTLSEEQIILLGDRVIANPCGPHRVGFQYIRHDNEASIAFRMSDRSAEELVDRLTKWVAQKEKELRELAAGQKIPAFYKRLLPSRQ